MKIIKLLLSLIIFISQAPFAQVPHLTGEIKISVLNGTIVGDLEYSNLPTLKNYSIWLNTGLNVRYFRDEADTFNYTPEKYYESEKSDEAFQYYFPDKDKKGKFLPSKFKINYVGKFPVINDTLRASNRNDWKGNIAFNGKTIRASEQTCWYPILYDVDNDVEINKVTYDLKIDCIDCESIYVNGSAPQKGKSVSATSNNPTALLMYAGIFDFTKNKETYFIDAKLNPEQEKVLNNWTEKIKGFYEGKLKIPYQNYVAYLSTTPISKKNAWLFVTYPTIAIIGHKYNLNYYFNPNENVLKDSSIIELLSHELGHYYFGTMFVPNAELRWFFLEGITEYLALQTIKEILGENYYKLQMSAHIKRVKDFNPKSLPTVKSNEINETYRYKYIPLLITALEKEIGKEKVWNWLATILKSDKSTKTDYDFLKTSLLKSGISDTTVKNFEEKYILSDKAKENVLRILNN